MKKHTDTTAAAAALFSQLSPEIQDRVIECMKALVADNVQSGAKKTVGVKRQRGSMMKYIATGVAACGFVLLLGTAGSSDVGVIGWQRMTVQIVMGLVMLIGGFFVSYVLERREP